MSAATLTKRLLSLDYVADEVQFFECLASILEEFIATRNPIFPRQDIIVQLMRVLTGSSSTLLIKLVLTTLIEFCTTSSTYSADFIKRQLVTHKIVNIICVVLSSSRLYKDKRLSELCMSLLRSLSDILLPVETTIVLSDILPLCISLCNMRKQLLFAFRPAIKQKLTEMVVNKTVVMREHTYETEASQVKCNLMLQLFGCKQVEMNYCVGDLFDTSSEVDKNVSEDIVGQGLAWYCTDGGVSEEPHKPDDVWRDIIPSEVVHGPHFFGHELDRLRQIAEIELVMQDMDHTPLASAPSPADLTTVRGPISSPHCKIDDSTDIYYRAQVCHKVKAGCYLVIALDYGQTKEVDQSQLHKPCQSLVHIHPSSTLFSLRGMKPSPFSIELLSTALSILQILTVGNFTVCETMVNQWSAITALLELASMSPDQSVCCKAMNVFTHLSHCSRVRCNELVKQETISKTIGVIKRFADMGWREAVLSASTALSAMVIDNPAATKQFERGMDTLVGLVAVYQGDEQVKTALLLSIRNHLGNVDICEMSSGISDLDIYSKSISPAKSTSPLSTMAGRDSVIKSISPPTFSVPSERPSREMSRSREYGGRERSSSKHRQIDLDSLSQQDLYKSPEKTKKSPVLAGNMASRRDFYTLDEKTELKMSDTTSTYETSSSMDCISVQKVLAGFLNTGISGRMIYGVTSEGIIRGINIDRDKRDQLRLGVDRVCTDLCPSLTAKPTLYFVPVCCKQGAGDVSLRTFIPDRFVVEIVVSAIHTITQAYRLKSDDRLFLRIGYQTREATIQDLREVVTRRIEETMDSVP